MAERTLPERIIWVGGLRGAYMDLIDKLKSLFRHKASSKRLENKKCRFVIGTLIIDVSNG